jgi:hypothetical protein
LEFERTSNHDPDGFCPEFVGGEKPSTAGTVYGGGRVETGWKDVTEAGVPPAVAGARPADSVAAEWVKTQNAL